MHVLVKRTMERRLLSVVVLLHLGALAMFFDGVLAIDDSDVPGNQAATIIGRNVSRSPPATDDHLDLTRQEPRGHRQPYLSPPPPWLAQLPVWKGRPWFGWSWRTGALNSQQQVLLVYFVLTLGKHVGLMFRSIS